MGRESRDQKTYCNGKNGGRERKRQFIDATFEEGKL